MGNLIMRGAAKEGRTNHRGTRQTDRQTHNEDELLLCDSSKMDSMTVTMAGHKARNGSRTDDPGPLAVLFPSSSHPPIGNLRTRALGGHRSRELRIEDYKKHQNVAPLPWMSALQPLGWEDTT